MTALRPHTLKFPIRQQKKSTLWDEVFSLGVGEGEKGEGNERSDRRGWVVEEVKEVTSVGWKGNFQCNRENAGLIRGDAIQSIKRPSVVAKLPVEAITWRTRWSRHICRRRGGGLTSPTHLALPGRPIFHLSIPPPTILPYQR